MGKPSARRRRPPATHAAARPTRAGSGRAGVGELRRQLDAARALLAEHTQTVQDLTNHREELQAQNAMLLKAERELWNARDMLSDLYELAPVPYMTLTRAAVITALNLSATRFLGGAKGTFVGKPFALLVAPADRPRFRQHVALCRRSGETKSIELMLNLDSSAASVQLLSALTNTGWIYTAIIDLRDRQRAEAERREMAVKQEASRAASHAKDEFLATLSHELRTPLTPVVAALANLRQGGATARRNSGELFDAIDRNLRQEIRLIDDLLDVTRLAHGKVSMEKKVIDVHDIIRQAVDQVRPDAVEKGVRLSSALTALRHHVNGDADRLRQVFANLLRNGVKFTPHGGRVVIASRSQRNQLAIDVRDSGVGIATEDQGRIFDRFAQGSGARPREGLGLGLAIAREIVEAHGGKIEARSLGAGQGATFEVQFATVATEAKRSARPAAAARPPLNGGAAASGKRILFVEDHPDTARLMADLLERAGHRVALAQSVAAAMSHADEPFDLLVSDIGLPDGSGVDLMRQLRARRPIRGIALSGYGGNDDIERSRAAGFDRHLVKPIDVPQLLQTIQELDTAPPAARRG